MPGHKDDATLLSHSPGWHKTYDDGLGIAFQRSHLGAGVLHQEEPDPRLCFVYNAILFYCSVLTDILGTVLDLSTLAEQIAARRRALRLTQAALGKKAGVGRSTIDALENGRMGELGYSKVTRILAALGLELTLREASPRRPTLDDLMQEDKNDQDLDRRS